MTTFSDQLYQYGGVPVGGLLTQGKVFHIKPHLGVNAGLGTNILEPYKTILYTHSQMTADQNDVALFYAGSNTGTYTTDYLLAAAPLVWSKDLTHLIGVGAVTPQGTRCRVAWSSATSTSSNTVMATFSGDSCFVANIAFFCGIDDANLSFNTLVSGSRNHFKNCYFAGIGHATNDVATAYSLTVSGDENLFEDCVIGLDTIIRATSTHECFITGKRNVFKNCTFLTYSETAGRFLVKIDNTAGDLRWNLFDRCRFCNYTANLATGQTNVFDMPAAGTSTAYVWLDNCTAFGGGAGGIGSAWADVDTSIFVSSPIPNTAGGKALAAT